MAYPMNDPSLSLFRPLDPGQIDDSIVENAKEAILSAPRGNLTPDTHFNFQRCILAILELSPNPNSAAKWIVKKLSPNSDGTEELLAKLYADIRAAYQYPRYHGRRPPKVGLCCVTGDVTSMTDTCPIIEFPTPRTFYLRLNAHVELVEAMFGKGAWFALLRNLAGLSSDQQDNGVMMNPTCHRAWKSMAFILAVDWSTHDSRTGEFDAKFEWVTAPQHAILNFWNGPAHTLPSGDPLFPPMASGSTIPFRRVAPPPLLPNGRQLYTPPVPSAHLLYIRGTLTRVAHLVGAAVDWEDGDDDYEEGSESDDKTLCGA
ncbi:MAG: hypothetical protein M1840_007849 [Geoglossum simile]|nr:MAG: hypothetical protein M1840_007849 [Geoglossum simile]